MKHKIKRYLQRVGSKNSIALYILGKIVQHTPNYQNRTFIDLFGGGGSMSSTATNFFDKVIYNEIETDVYRGFIDVQDTDLIKNLKKRRITREEFFSLDPEKKEDNILLTMRSFSNNRKSYIYGKSIERRKEILHRITFCNNQEDYIDLIKIRNDEKLGHIEKYGAIWDCYLTDTDWDEFIKSKSPRHYKFGSGAKYIREFIKGFDIDLLKEKRGGFVGKKNKELIKHTEKQNNQLQSLQSLESLERLQSLQSLENTQGIIYENKDYRDVSLPDPEQCVIYLDPPYRNTASYETEFNFEEFDNRVQQKKQEGYIIFISEYNLPYGEVIRSKKKKSMKATTIKNQVIERLYMI